MRLLAVGVALALLSASAAKSEVETTPTPAISSDYNESEDYWLTFDPWNRTETEVNHIVPVRLKLSMPLNDYAIDHSARGSTFFVGVIYDRSNEDLTNMISVSRSSKLDSLSSKTYNLTYALFWALQLNFTASKSVATSKAANGTNINEFMVSLTGIGYPSIGVDILERTQDNVTKVLLRETYIMRLIRKYRTVDLGFTIAITVVGMLNIFAIGCLTEVNVLRTQFRKSLIPVCLASGTQYIITPLVRGVLSIHMQYASIIQSCIYHS